MKRFVCLVLATILSLTTFAFADVYKKGDWRYRVIGNNKCELVEYVGNDTHVMLPEIINGNSVISLGKFVFENCTGIQSITLTKSVTKVDTYSLWATYELTAVYVADGNDVYESIDGVLFDKRTSTLVHYPSASPISSYIVPTGTLSIGSQAFNSCSNLQTITFPDSLISLGDAAITWCDNLKEVVIPFGVTTIGVETLAYCSQLETIHVPASVTDIGIFALSSPATNFKLVVDKGSYAEQYAIESQRPYVYSTDYVAAPADIEITTTNSSNLTIINCPDLATILSLKASYDSRYTDFANEYKGRIIEFDGRIDYITNHRSYKTRFDILLSAGNYDPNHMIGPAFKFEDVAAYDLGLDTLFLEDEIWVGRNVHIIAEVDYYDSPSELFYLIPVSVTGR